MGYTKHHAIIITSRGREDLDEVHKMAIKIFEEVRKNEISSNTIVSPIIDSFVNNYKSFFIAPDGSEEGWSTSEVCNKARIDFLDWLQSSNNNCDYIEIVFGGDDDHQSILRSRDSDLEKLLMENNF